MTTNSNHYKTFFFSVLLIAVFTFTGNTVIAQKWMPGHFTDVKGMRSDGFIYPNPGGKGPFRNEGFIEFKDAEKSTSYFLSTSDLQSFVAGQDSFVVAHAPGNETWAKRDFDFVRVALNEDVKIYATRGAGSGGSGGGKKVQVAPAVGIGAGSYGASYGGGVGISIGGNGGGTCKMTYYYGENTATMKHLTNENFIDIMSEAMGDEPEVVQQIRANRYNIGSIEKLIAYFNKAKASHR